MYIHPFLTGILATIGVEFIAIIAYGLYATRGKK